MCGSFDQDIYILRRNPTRDTCGSEFSQNGHHWRKPCDTSVENGTCTIVPLINKSNATVVEYFLPDGGFNRGKTETIWQCDVCVASHNFSEYASLNFHLPF